MHCRNDGKRRDTAAIQTEQSACSFINALHKGLMQIAWACDMGLQQDGNRKRNKTIEAAI